MDSRVVGAHEQEQGLGGSPELKRWKSMGSFFEVQGVVSI